MGYQTGKSFRTDQKAEIYQKDSTQPVQEFKIDRENTPKQKETPKIDRELSLHKKKTATEPIKEKPTVFKAKTITKTPYYTIQVGAFKSYSNAQNYSKKFGRMGYPTEILSTVQKSRKLFRVRVGNYTDKSKAQREMKKLETMEKKKFRLIQSK
jgi:cell division septation protein DedD